MHADVLYILSPVPVNCKLAPAFSRPCPPCMRSDPLMVLLAGPVVKCEMAMLELVVNVFCLVLTAAEIVVMMSVPPIYKGLVIRALLPQIKLPDTSKDGALTAQLNVALLLVIPSLSVLFESAKRSV